MLRGTLRTWNDDKGFGFIRLENEARDIFIHISALKNMSRRPILGDIIQFDVEIEDGGKPKATNASIEGVSSVYFDSRSPALRPRVRETSRTGTARFRESKFRLNSASHDVSKFSVSNLLYLVVIVVGLLFLGKSINRIYLATSPVERIPVTTQKQNGQYHCEGKTMCSEMSSCDEAIFYINNCPGTKMDGDADGTPCESQWCN